MINCDEENTYRVIPYEQGLMFPLRLYHIAYQKFTIEKDKSFAEQLIEIVEGTLKNCQTEDMRSVIRQLQQKTRLMRFIILPRISFPRH